MKTLSYTCITALLICLLPLTNPALAQNVNGEGTETATAILDTSLPFAIGAREGAQTIRGSFGWPTFQEGFVEGVYFRFDPDGYARFSTSPRLDEDVFEVTCQNATTICVAQKNGLEIGLTPQGNPQINISGITPADTFFISDRKNELPLPNSILGPIDQRLEALLSTGEKLIIRRELETLQAFSLSGFAATVTYLRWVSQNQASFVFPRGWPVPSQQTGQQNADLTSPDAWVNTRSAGLQTTQPTQALRQNVQKVTNGNTQFPAVPAQPLTTRDYDTFANSFARQAQGRSLPADVNRFEVIPSQNNQRQNTIQATQYNPINAQGTSLKIVAELALLNESLRNLEIKIDNLSLRLSNKLRPVDNNTARQNGSLSEAYQRLAENAKSTGILPERTNPQISEEERIRKLVVESILKQSTQDNSIGSGTSNPSANGEISVKKNIVERLLEELNGTVEKQEEPAPSVVKNTGEFISLSDYVNKIMQAENRN
ncbi:MAG: hypothetical protein IME92_06825 [Proteobacteria bacterium]|nr:hypothetical protein [Pseudomonadota bacterium]